MRAFLTRWTGLAALATNTYSFRLPGQVDMGGYRVLHVHVGKGEMLTGILTS